MLAVSNDGKKKATRLLLPDADVLGFAAATFVAGGVAAAGLFWLKLTAFETVLRSGVTFVVTYAAVFLLVRYIVWTLLREIAEKRRRDFEKQRQAQAQSGAGPAAEHESGETGR